MGLCDSWIIVQDMNKEALWDFFDLEEVEARPLRPAYGYIELADGWSVLWSGPRGFDGRDELKDLSRSNFALRLHLNDKSYYHSTLMAAKSGKLLWTVSVGNQGLMASKAAPKKFGPLKNLAKDFNGQMGGDYDIPSALAKAMTGFDIDDFFANERYLQPRSGSPLAAPHPGWLKRSTGRPLLRAIEWWWYFCCDAGKFCGAVVESCVTAFLFIGVVGVPLAAAAWVIGTMWRAS